MKTEQRIRERKAALASGEYPVRERRHRSEGKFSCVMAIILGLLVTLEIMVAGAMLFNIDIHAADGIALTLAFMVLYFGVVAALTDR